MPTSFLVKDRKQILGSNLPTLGTQHHQPTYESAFEIGKLDPVLAVFKYLQHRLRSYLGRRFTLGQKPADDTEHHRRERQKSLGKNSPKKRMHTAAAAPHTVCIFGESPHTITDSADDADEYITLTRLLPISSATVVLPISETAE